MPEHFGRVSHIASPRGRKPRLRYFVAVAERLSISRAAEDLPLSQSALSEAVRRLEAEVGTQLLRRNSRRVELTAPGEVLLTDAREVLAHLDHAIGRAERTGRGEIGRLRVGFEASGAGELSTLARARFGREHPAVRVEPNASTGAGSRWTPFGRPPNASVLRAPAATESPSGSAATPAAWCRSAVDATRAYDRGKLDLLSYLEPGWRAQLAHAVGHVGLVGARRRISGHREPSDENDR